MFLRMNPIILPRSCRPLLSSFSEVSLNRYREVNFPNLVWSSWRYKTLGLKNQRCDHKKRNEKSCLDFHCKPRYWRVNTGKKPQSFQPNCCFSFFYYLSLRLISQRSRLINSPIGRENFLTFYGINISLVTIETYS